MASMRLLFPFKDTRPRSQRNFIKENIQGSKGYSQCIIEKRNMKTNEPSQNNQNAISAKYKTKKRVPTSSLKCNVRVLRCDNGFTKNESHSGNHSRNSDDVEDNQICTSETLTSSIKNCITCESCGQLVINNRSTRTHSNEQKSCNSNSEEDNKDISSHQGTNYHRLSHENEDQIKINALFKKCLDLSHYKKGEVPRYLKERNARLKQEQEGKEEHEKLAKLLGLNDPNCPPGHMLMAPGQVEENLRILEEKCQSLIQELNRMPVSSDSLRIRTRKIEIEKELKDLDDNIAQYKSGKVFVKVNE